LGFSADGSFVTVWERRSDGSRSGDVDILATPTKGGSLRPYLPEAAEVSWSSDGTRIVYHTSDPGDPLFVREPGQPAARRIYAAPAGVHCHFPIWSPNDEFIYFVRGVPLEAWDIWRVRPSGSDLERITFQNSLVSHPVLLDSRTLVYLAADADGSGPWLYAMDVNEHIPRRISSGLERYTSLAASADGKRLVATVANPKTSLWSLSILEGGAVPTSAVRISSESVTELSPRFGPNYLLYISYKGGRLGIVKRVNGTNSDLWSDAHGTITGVPAISPNGRRIAFTVSDGARTLLYVMESDGSQAKVVTDSLHLRGNPAWAPDGQSVVSAVAQDGQPRLATIFLNGVSPIALVAEYSIDPVWSPDGQFLLYSGADLGTTFPLRAVAGNGKLYGGLLTPILTRGARRVVFWRDSQAIVVLRGEIGHKNFWLVDLKTGTERRLTDLPPDFDIRDFDVSSDGSQIIFDRLEESSQIAVIERAG
jgi:Tol biopolymer transport system component